ncbi:MAG: hypothetical protein QOF84_5230 [Streptomyces sp.]|nr:hypothetical protein [Streptomyces sp.]
MGGPEEEERTPERKVLDLSVVQVVASALAAVVGAILASLLGVHGTIVGAAVVSTSATTGAAVFQHAFRRTGEGIRSRVPRTPRAPRRAAGKRQGWKTYALTTGLVFGLAMGLVTAAELIMGKPVAAVVKNEPGHGTSLGGGSDGTPRPSPTRTPTPAASTAPVPRADSSASPGATAGTTPRSTRSPGPTSSSNAAASPTPSSGSATRSAGATAG